MAAARARSAVARRLVARVIRWAMSARYRAAPAGSFGMGPRPAVSDAAWAVAGAAGVTGVAVVDWADDVELEAVAERNALPALAGTQIAPATRAARATDPPAPWIR